MDYILSMAARAVPVATAAAEAIDLSERKNDNRMSAEVRLQEVQTNLRDARNIELTYDLLIGMIGELWDTIGGSSILSNAVNTCANYIGARSNGHRRS